VWLDADTGNEMDDVYAIVRLLWAADRLDIVGLSSAHFNNADLVAFDKWNQYNTAGLSPVRVSQELNEEILTTMGRQQIPHPMGADRQMGRAWGGFQPRPSAATEGMMQAVKYLGAGEKLDILTLGALTNVASLIALDSTVKSRIRVYSLGGGYDFAKKAWNKNEFNVRCDLNAYDFMLNQANLDWTVMPIHSVMHYKFDREMVYENFADNNPVEQLMEKRWRETNPQDKTRTLWDLGLVQAYLLPKLAPVATVASPSENTQPTVKIFTKLDAKGMNADFWEQVKKHR
jgi:inosine-uridine nucleoside N-ribohydrolase